LFSSSDCWGVSTVFSVKVVSKTLLKRGLNKGVQGTIEH